MSAQPKERRPVQVRRLVPVDVEDAFAAAKTFFKMLGWTVLDEDYEIRRCSPDWLEVTLWAITPKGWMTGE